jgi:predicted nucleic acid-binding protein
MFTVDANVFVRDLDARHADHADCNALLEHLARTTTPIVVPALLLAEVAGALSRELHDPMRGRLAVVLLQELPHVTLVALDDVLAREAAELAADRARRGADACYVAVARRYNCTLVTLDREQRERAAAIVPVLTPAGALAALTTPPNHGDIPIG